MCCCKNMKRVTKFKCCGITSVVIGVILLGLGIGWPFIIDSVVKGQVKSQTALGKDNQDQWKGIPGKFDIQLNRNTYTYNVKNREDVIFKGAVPVVEEYGPFIYREYDEYGEPDQWDAKTPVPGQDGTTKNGIRMNFNQFAKYNTGADYKNKQDQDLDKPIWQINQAALGVWFAATNPPSWRLALNLLYSVVIDGLGRQVVQTGGFTLIAKLVTGPDQVKTYLFPNGGLTDPQAAAIFNDPLWGVSQLNNLIRWDALTYRQDPVWYQSAINELKGRFGLTQEQIEIVTKQWNTFTLLGKGVVIADTPSEGQNLQGVAYAQWSNSFVTGNVSDPSQPSVIFASDTATGYPEISYFFVSKFIPAIGQNKDLYDMFKDVKLYVTFVSGETGKNYEYLFDMDDKNGGDPPERSLFNVQTLQELMAAGEATIDIVENNETPIDKFDLTKITPVAQKLQLSEQQTYLIYIWLKYVKIATFQRQQDGGSTAAGVSSQLSSQALAQQMYTMEQEVPMILYTYQLVSVVGEVSDCVAFYKTNFKFSQDLASNLCSGGALKIDTFSFKDVQATCKAWINIAMNNNTMTPSIYADLVFLSSMTGAELDQLLFYSTSTFQTYLQTNVFSVIYTQYSDKVCKTNPDKKICTNKELAYTQWLDQSIFANPPKSVPATTDSYVNVYKDFTSLKIQPELSNFIAKSGVDPIKATLNDAMEIFQTNRLFNLEIVGDILLMKQGKYTQAFTNPTMGRYIKYVMIELALNGLFQYRTSREYIEGFTDPLVYQASQQPVWNGGDQTNNPFMSINESPTNPANNPITFFTGSDDFQYTRSFAKWLDQDYVCMKRKDYASIYNMVDTYPSPWSEKIYLKGTDGFQFHSNLEKTDQLWVWVNDIGRNGYFDYLSEDKETYDGLNMLTFQISTKLMDKNYPDNKLYGTFLDGTTPLFSVLQAPVLASKGHYYQIDKDAQDKVATMVDKQGNQIMPKQAEDDTFLGMEQLSGVNVQARQRLQMNFFIKKDFLFEHLQKDFIMTPLTFIKRESIMPLSMVKAILEPLYIAKTARLVGLIVLLVIAVLLLLLAIFMFCRMRRIQKNEQLGVFDEVSPAGFQYKNINESKEVSFLNNSGASREGQTHTPQ